IAGGHDGSLEGDPQWTVGQIGGALEFDGTDDFIDCGSSTDYEIPVNITIACWIKLDVFDKTWQAIITTSDSSWRVHRSGSTNNIAWGTTGLAPLDLTGSTDVSTGDWFHVAGVYDGSQKLLYINGELDASSNSTGNISTVTTPVFIGENSGARNRYWAGLIDDVRIYNNALTQAEIQSAMLGEGFPYASMVQSIMIHG
ncbi:MAG: LamG domain-containing protein, partial [Planctomycetota bacterium]